MTFLWRTHHVKYDVLYLKITNVVDVGMMGLLYLWTRCEYRIFSSFVFFFVFSFAVFIVAEWFGPIFYGPIGAKCHMERNNKARILFSVDIDPIHKVASCSPQRWVTVRGNIHRMGAVFLSKPFTNRGTRTFFGHHDTSIYSSCRSNGISLGT